MSEIIVSVEGLIRGREVKGQKTATMKIETAKDLEVYQIAYSLAMRIFEISKRFPDEERWALTGQIRRSSRSVCLNLREAWSKRRYEAHFVSKLSDCDGENSETDSALDFAKDCGYISCEQHAQLAEQNRSMGRMLGSMLKNPAPFLISDLRLQTSDQMSEAIITIEVSVGSNG